MSPLFPSLQAAALAAIAHDNIPGEINHAKWAETYRCTVDDVSEALKIALNGSNKLPEEIAAGSSEAIPHHQEDEE